MLAVKNPGLPETIYLQCYDEYTGDLLDFISDDVTWCRDRINDNDATYVLATPELVELLDKLFKIAQRARALQVHIKDSLG